MTEIIIISGLKVLIDQDDLQRVIHAGPWRKLNSSKKNYFIHTGPRCPKRTTTLLHRFIVNAPDGMEVDHISGDTLDNTKGNLRLCQHKENQRNTKLRRTNKSGYKGVSSCSKSSRRWRSRITVDQKEIVLGYFDTPEKAHEAYCIASKKYHGDFGRTQ